MEPHRPEKLLTRIRACPELGKGMPPAWSIMPIAPGRPMWTEVSPWELHSCFDSRLSSQTGPPGGTWVHWVVHDPLKGCFVTYLN
jgi:hypothetical protein